MAKPRISTRAEHEQQHHRQQRGDVGIEDRRPGPRIALRQRLDGCGALCRFLADAAEDQDVAVHRDAEAQDDARDPRQRQRGAQQAKGRQRQHDVQPEDRAGQQAPAAVEPHHHRHDQRQAHGAGNEPGLDGICAKSGADAAFLDHLQRGRQRARCQQHRERLRLFHRELAGDLALSARNGGLDHRRGQHRAIEDDGKALADVGSGDIGKDDGPLPVEGEGDHRTPGIRIERRGRPVQPVARERHAILDRDRPGTVAHLQHRHAGPGPGGDHLEAHLRGRAQQFAKLGRVLHPGHLHEDPVLADATDHGFRYADLIDAVADHLEAAVCGSGGGTIEPRLGQGQSQDAVGQVHGEIGWTARL